MPIGAQSNRRDGAFSRLPGAGAGRDPLPPSPSTMKGCQPSVLGEKLNWLDPATPGRADRSASDPARPAAHPQRPGVLQRDHDRRGIGMPRDRANRATSMWRRSQRADIERRSLCGRRHAGDANGDRRHTRKARRRPPMDACASGHGVDAGCGCNHHRRAPDRQQGTGDTTRRRTAGKKRWESTTASADPPNSRRGLGPRIAVGRRTAGGREGLRRRDGTNGVWVVISQPARLPGVRRDVADGVGPRSLVVPTSTARRTLAPVDRYATMTIA